MLRRVVVLVVSCAVLGVGVTLLLRAALGSDGYSTFINGLHLSTGIAFSVVNIGAAVILVLLAWWKGARPGLGTVVQPVVTGIVVDVGLRVVDQPASMVARILMLAAAFVIVVLGVAGYLATDTGAGPAEALAVAWDPPFPFRWSYSLFQAVGALVGWLLGASLGVGTVIVVLLIGPAVSWLETHLRRSPLFPTPRPS